MDGYIFDSPVSHHESITVLQPVSTQQSWEMPGGLYQSLHFYDTVEQLNVDTSRDKVEQLMKKIGAEPAAIPGNSSGHDQ